MPINILMPALSPTMEKGNLAKWLKKEGDKVKAGDILAEIETDKATMEYEAIEDGVLAKILVQEGTADVAVNEPIAVLAAEGEDLKAVAAPSTSKPAVPSEPRPAPSAPPSPKTRRDEAQPTSGQNPSWSSGRTASLGEPGGVPATNGHAGRIFASPLARRLAKAAGIDVVRIPGSGPHGRIVARDVEAAMPDGAALRAPAPQPPAP